MDAEEIARFLNHKRKAAGIRPRHLAERAQCHENTIKRWLEGKGLSTLEGVLRVCEALGCELYVRPTTPHRDKTTQNRPQTVTPPPHPREPGPHGSGHESG